MTKTISFDDSVTATNLPTTQKYGVYYVDGKYANEAAVKVRLPKAKLLGITVTGKTGPDVAVCDCEKGDLTVAQAVAWVEAQIKLDVDPLVVYANASTWSGGLKADLAKYGKRIKRWVASYPGIGAKVPSGFDAHQYAGGVNVPVDRNIALATFFTPSALPPSGVGKFSGTFNCDTGKWTIKHRHGSVKWHGKPAAWTASLTASVEGSKGVTYQIHGTPDAR